MAAKKKATRQEMINAALDIVRKEGIEQLNARNLAKKLNCSTQPIYFEFNNMDEIKVELKQEAEKRYNDYVELYMKKSEYKPYKSFGLGFTRFAIEECELFRFLYLNGNVVQQENDFGDINTSKSRLTLMKDYGITEKEAAWFHYHMSVYCYGLGVMLNTKFIVLNDQEISKRLDEQFYALIKVCAESVNK